MRARVVLLVIAVVATVISCSDQPGKPAAKAAAEASAGLARIQEVRSELVKVWDRLDTLRDELDSLDALPRLNPAEAARKMELTTQIKEAEGRFETAYGADQSALAEFLNEALNSRPKDDSTLTALRLYLDSALRNASDFVARSGDYRRAIELLETARGYYEAVSAPTPADLTAAIEGARDYRVITRTRFDQLRKGMRPAEVKALVGVPYYANIRHSEAGGKQVTTWLYSRDDGEVAAVYLDDRGQLYAWKWDVKHSE